MGNKRGMKNIYGLKVDKDCQMRLHEDIRVRFTKREGRVNYGWVG